MTITEKEIRDDFLRFLRHESMRANLHQDEILDIITPVLPPQCRLVSPA